MKISTCEVCYYQEKKLVESTHRVGLKLGPQSIRIDSCEKHRGFFKGCKDMDEATKRYRELMAGVA